MVEESIVETNYELCMIQLKIYDMIIWINIVVHECITNHEIDTRHWLWIFNWTEQHYITIIVDVHRISKDQTYMLHGMMRKYVRRNVLGSWNKCRDVRENSQSQHVGWLFFSNKCLFYSGVLARSTL